jgi:hypothetical protein
MMLILRRYQPLCDVSMNLYRLGTRANDSVSTDEHNAVDGLVAVLTVKIVGRPEPVEDK